MLTSKVTSKGQITIPKEVREQLGIHPGENLGFIEKNGLFFIKKTVKKSPFNKWVGALKATGKKPKSDEIVEELRGK